MNAGSDAQFELAADAITAGDADTLRRLLWENPELIRARSTRAHRGTLLHYVGANGIEDFRQKTPRNAVEILRILLAAGAEVDATAEMYGHDTTLALVATSVHPLAAGVQEDLLQTLLAAGAAVDPGGVVNACLANGRGAAAEFLAARGARLDLEGAAGVGRLDLVESFFLPNGTLTAGATKAQMASGFAWACEYGRTGVVDFLLRMGAAMDGGLHWAAYGGHLDTVTLLLERGAPVDAKDARYGATPLEWALHEWGETRHQAHRGRYYEVAGMLVRAGARLDPERAREKAGGDPRMLAVLQAGQAP